MNRMILLSTLYAKPSELEDFVTVVGLSAMMHYSYWWRASGSGTNLIHVYMVF